MTIEYSSSQAVKEKYLSNNQFNVASPFEVIYVPSKTMDYIKCELNQPVDILLDVNKVKELGKSVLEKLVFLNTFKSFSYDHNHLDICTGAEILLPLLFEAYNIHAHWLNGMDDEDALELVKFIPLAKAIDNPFGTMILAEYQAKATEMLNSMVNGAMSIVSNPAPIYDDVTLSKCGKYVFVPVPLSDYTYPDIGIDTVKIYAKKLMKSILIKANSHHHETSVSNSSLFASYITSLSLQIN